ncbi:TPA: DUF3158 family protein [Pseudomonas aeruginosa]|nr:DUF3158 family protein [Pseudomonas aeruginosa]HBP6102095.1 DUF3158 family protein [Pseudomonas aeruginosa]HCF4685352.1 DUF3158 family protein [Pseudomonas aeruginosa]HCF4691415.1 DUF3158 family protein [Pseudomonas aeruginosa]HCR1420874.1 DUF3158 family protein [Pseudomonas aeruginosa]
MPQRYFRPLEQPAFMRLEHAGYLKGLLRPFKSKGALEDWASLCFDLRDSLISLAQQQVLAQAGGHPLRNGPASNADGHRQHPNRRPGTGARGGGLLQ